MDFLLVTPPLDPVDEPRVAVTTFQSLQLEVDGLYVALELLRVAVHVVAVRAAHVALVQRILRELDRTWNSVR